MKSSVKMRGLINVSGFHVDPGYHGHLLFSVYNAGPNPIVLDQEAPTFLLWYVSLDQPTEDLYEGNRTGLDDITAADVSQIQGDIYSPQALAERLQETQTKLNASEAARDLLAQRVDDLASSVNTKLKRQVDRSNLWIALVGAAVGVVLSIVAAVAIQSRDDDPPRTPSPRLIIAIGEVPASGPLRYPIAVT